MSSIGSGNGPFRRRIGVRGFHRVTVRVHGTASGKVRRRRRRRRLKSFRERMEIPIPIPIPITWGSCSREETKLGEEEEALSSFLDFLGSFLRPPPLSLSLLLPLHNSGSVLSSLSLSSSLSRKHFWKRFCAYNLSLPFCSITLRGSLFVCVRVGWSLYAPNTYKYIYFFI